jgi:hypothetical protein
MMEEMASKGIKHMTQTVHHVQHGHDHEGNYFHGGESANANVSGKGTLTDCGVRRERERASENVNGTVYCRHLLPFE